MEIYRIRHYGDCLEPLGITDGLILEKDNEQSK